VCDVAISHDEILIAHHGGGAFFGAAVDRDEFSMTFFEPIFVKVFWS